MTTSSQMDWEDVRPDTLRVAAVADGRGAVQVYTVSSPRDGDRWPGHLAELLSMVPGAVFDPTRRTWTVRARRRRWLMAALGATMPSRSTRRPPEP